MAMHIAQRHQGDAAVRADRLQAFEPGFVVHGVQLL